MAIIVLQHSDIGTVGRLGSALRDIGLLLDVRRPDMAGVGGARGVPMNLDGVDGLIILGGPQNVTDIETIPWMPHEVSLIQAAHARELPVIGVCLGAQLIAHALGGKVTAREKPAVGLLPVSLTSAGQTDVLLAGVAWEHPQLFSCGQEVSQLPPGATLLVSSKHTRHVTYRVGVRTVGFIQHLECTRPMLDALMRDSRREMERCATTEAEVRVAADQVGDQFARASERIAENLGTLLFPASRRRV